jgi:hypothetical protein
VAARDTTQERSAYDLCGLKGKQEVVLERATLKLSRELFI